MPSAVSRSSAAVTRPAWTAQAPAAISPVRACCSCGTSVRDSQATSASHAVSSAAHAPRRRARTINGIAMAAATTRAASSHHTQLGTPESSVVGAGAVVAEGVGVGVGVGVTVTVVVSGVGLGASLVDGLAGLVLVEVGESESELDDELDDEDELDEELDDELEDDVSSGVRVGTRRRHRRQRRGRRARRGRQVGGAPAASAQDGSTAERHGNEYDGDARSGHVCGPSDVRIGGRPLAPSPADHTRAGQRVTRRG